MGASHSGQLSCSPSSRVSTMALATLVIENQSLSTSNGRMMTSMTSSGTLESEKISQTNQKDLVHHSLCRAEVRDRDLRWRLEECIICPREKTTSQSTATPYTATPGTESRVKIKNFINGEKKKL